MPKANRDYWVAKITRNRARDAVVQEELASMGWKSLAVYECQLKDGAALSERLTSFLS